MKNVNWKKLIIPNIPYLLFVYLFDKVSQAARLAVAVTIRNPLSLTSSSRLSSCLRCVDLSASLSGKKNVSTDISKRVTSS